MVLRHRVLLSYEAEAEGVLSEDIIDADPNLPDRKNSVAISRAFQAHVLGGIEWALGLKGSDAPGQ